MKKENIRKVIHRKRKESRTNYKMLQSIAIDCNYQDSLKIRKQEVTEWNKFKFFNNLMLALDKGDANKNG